MTIQDFSNRFDTLINSYASSLSYGVSQSQLEFDEYEKSILLTTAQEQIVEEIYSGTFTGDSMEKTEELRRELDCLVKTASPTLIGEESTGLSKNSVFYQLPEDVWVITYESIDLEDGAYCSGNNTIRVIPVRQDEWHRIKDNPFRQPNKRKAIRLDSGSKIAEIISKYSTSNYLIRYLRKPTPIVLVDLDGLEINGVSEQTECELNAAFHNSILERAVQLGLRRIPQSSK